MAKKRSGSPKLASEWVPSRKRPKSRVVKLATNYSKDANHFTVINRRYLRFFEEGEWMLPQYLRLGEVGTRLREKSSHGVFPTLAKLQVKVGRKQAQLVIKPYQVQKTKKPKIEIEFENTRKAYELGISSIEPVGMFIDKNEGKGYLYTLANPRAIPLSKVNYDKIQTSKRKILIMALAGHMSSWHTNGFVHNDAKLKNILFDNVMSKIRLHPIEIKTKGESFQFKIEEQSPTKNPVKVVLDVIDLENSNFLNRAANKHERGYDLASVVGDSIRLGLIKHPNDLDLFLENYDSENKQDWFEHLKERIVMHPHDKNILAIKEFLDKHYPH